MDKRRGRRRQRLLTNFIPQPCEIVEVAFDFRFCARKTGRADDQSHGLRELQVRDDLLQTFAVAG